MYPRGLRPMIYILGIDPGAHGGYCFKFLDGTDNKTFAFNKQTPAEIVKTIENYIDTMRFINGIESITAFIEEVHTMPHDGKVSAFSFGKNYGWWLGVLTSLKIPIIEIPPAKWQAGLKLRVRGLEYRDKKKALKEAAQKRFPDLNLTLDTCDAALIAEYGRQIILAERMAAK